MQGLPVDRFKHTTPARWQIRAMPASGRFVLHRPFDGFVLVKPVMTVKIISIPIIPTFVDSILDAMYLYHAGTKRNYNQYIGDIWEATSLWPPI